MAAWPAVTGESIGVYGRFFDSRGRDWETCYVWVSKPGTGVYQSRGTQVKRCWPGFYYLHLELPPVAEAGIYRIVVSRLAMYSGEDTTFYGSLDVSEPHRFPTTQNPSPH